MLQYCEEKKTCSASDTNSLKNHTCCYTLNKYAALFVFKGSLMVSPIPEASLLPISHHNSPLESN